jgi:hypothetical protein
MRQFGDNLQQTHCYRDDLQWVMSHLVSPRQDE